MAPAWLLLFVMAQAQAPPTPPGQGARAPSPAPIEAVLFPRVTLDRLPTARNLWVVLESQAPGVVTDRIDVGGLRALTPARLGGHGPSWTQNAYVIDGLDVSDPYSGDRPLVYPDFDVIESLAVSTMAHDATAAVPGIELALATRQGGDRLRGSAQVYYAGDATQADNVDAAKRRLGVRSPERLRHALDGNLNLGGPLLTGRAWGFLSLSALDRSVSPHNVASAVDSRLLSALARITARAGSHDLSLLGERQSLRNPRLGLSSRVGLDSTLDHRSASWLAQLSDLLSLGDRFSVEGRLGVAREHSDGRLQAGVARQSGMELFSGTRFGPAPIGEEGVRTRLGARAVLSGIAETDVLTHAGHQFRAGLAWDESWCRRSLLARDNLQLEFLKGDPYAVRLLNTPLATRQRLRSLALLAQDAVRFSRHYRLDLGLRLESASGGLPDAPAAIRWTTLSPRLGIAVEPVARLTLRASYARYAHRLLGSHIELADSAALGGSRRLWRDENADGQYQPGEEDGLLQRFGGPVSRVDPSLKPPTTREVTVGADLRMGRTTLSVTASDRRDGDLIETVNEGVPLSAYSSMPFLDAGGDVTLGTSDDRVLTVYEQARESLGHDAFLLTNPAGFRTSYQGVEVGARVGDLSARFFLRVSAAAFRIVGPASQAAESQEYDPGVVGSLFDDPNSLLNADNRLFFDRAYVVKVAVAQRLPWGLEAAAVAKYYDGLPFGRKVVVTGLNQGPFYVFATPRGNRSVGVNGHRVEYNATLDVGVEKRVALWRGTLCLRLDAFNVLNASNNTREADLSGPAFNDRVPLEIQAPRVVRLGLRLDF